MQHSVWAAKKNKLEKKRDGSHEEIIIFVKFSFREFL